jgi:hypothetical protein
MRGIFVDIENELSDIANEVAMLTEAVDVYRVESEQQSAAWKWLAVQGLASGVEKIYSGCERVMQMIASEVDGSKVDHTEGWHISLLKRMAHPFPGVRDHVISDNTFVALDGLRAFRHRQRNSYGLILDSQKVLERAGETKSAFEQFRADVRAYATKSAQ